MDAALSAGFDNWRVESTDATLTLQRNRRGEISVSRGPPPVIPARDPSAPASAASPAGAPGLAGRARGMAPALAHDRAKPRLLPEGSALYAELGMAAADGKPKAAYASKGALSPLRCRAAQPRPTLLQCPYNQLFRHGFSHRS